MTSDDPRSKSRRGLRPVGRVVAHWRAERRTIRQGMAALVVATGGNVAAGVMLGSVTTTLRSVPGLFILLPAAIAMRGSIFGALGSRLGTSIHAGSLAPERRRRTLIDNAVTAGVLTCSVSLAIGVGAKILATVFGVHDVSVVDLVTISVAGGVAASVVVGGLTLALAVSANRRDWDLDSVAAPMVTAIGDLVTIPTLFAATLLVGHVVTPALAAVAAMACVAATVYGAVSRQPMVRRAVRESLPVLLAVGVLALGAGVIIDARLERFVAMPALLVLLPPLLADAGALGSILSSRLASKLHLGVIGPRRLPQAPALLDTTIVVGFALWLFVLLGVGAHVVASALGLASPGALRLIAIALLAGMTATAVAIVLAYYAAIASFRVGLDPDNHAIPVITSTMDLVAAVTFVAAMSAFGFH